MSRMLKYQVAGSTSMSVAVPMREGAVIRAVGAQHGGIYVWAETPVQADPLTVTRTFRTVPTGGDVPNPGTYLGTAFDGPFVWHIYEVTT